MKSKLHPYFLIIPAFGLSKMELSFIFGSRGCNAVYDGHVYTFDRKKDSGVMCWQCKGNGLSNARSYYIVDAWEELKPAILHYSSTTETRNYLDYMEFTAAYIR